MVEKVVRLGERLVVVASGRVVAIDKWSIDGVAISFWTDNK